MGLRWACTHIEGWLDALANQLKFYGLSSVNAELMVVPSDHKLKSPSNTCSSVPKDHLFPPSRTISILPSIAKPKKI